MLPENIQNLIDQFSRLPGVGPKTAARLVFYLLSKPEREVSDLGKAVLNLLPGITLCGSCYNFSEGSICSVCADDKRNRSLIAVVEEALDVVALEKTRCFPGVYHVLGGVISPINGIGPDDIRVNQLIARIKQGDVTEIILSTNPNLEGEATASYVKQKVDETGLGIKVTRIARGLPMGGDLEYADEVTLKRSLEGRREY
ncbi:MAG: recombination mediator RecR [Candidatus Berkelbacteria bacterium]